MDMMDLDFPGDPLCVKLEPSESGMVSPCSSTLMNGSKPLSEFNSDSDSSPGKTYQCDGGDLNCNGGDLNCIASSPDSIENKHDYCSSTLSLEQDGNPEAPKRLCLVCGDVASGYHYGVASCEACKAFFKRTIQGNIEYSCPANNTCEITKRRRKACQACRFQKCLRMGMLKEGVRLDRVRGGRQKYKRSPDAPPTPITQHTPLPKKACIEGPVYGCNLSPSPTSPRDAFLFPSPQSEPVSLCLVPGRFATFQQPKPSSKNKMLSALLSIEPEKVYALPDSSLPDDEFKFMCTLTDLSDRELVATIGWAKQVPGFINLPLGDQMNLLQSTWLDILCFNLAYRSTPYKGILVFADDFQCLDEDSVKYQIPSGFDRVARKIARKLTDLRMTREEYVFMKAILLLNPDVSMENPETVQQLRDRMQESLLEFERSIGSQPHRVGNLLLCLPFIMQEKMLAVQYWAQVKKDGRVPLHKLLSEMLEFAIT